MTTNCFVGFLNRSQRPASIVQNPRELDEVGPILSLRHKLSLVELGWVDSVGVDGGTDGLQIYCFAGNIDLVATTE
ncbi:hypothetical protein PM082_002374 [Marasmius tenuissimus]|nr:hypothetical protein PM082_002374 [Marasmius tenuissimus]